MFRSSDSRSCHCSVQRFLRVFGPGVRHAGLTAVAFLSSGSYLGFGSLVRSRLHSRRCIPLTSLVPEDLALSFRFVLLRLDVWSHSVSFDAQPSFPVFGSVISLLLT